jgi:hypothetical protein
MTALPQELHLALRANGMAGPMGPIVQAKAEFRRMALGPSGTELPTPET